MSLYKPFLDKNTPSSKKYSVYVVKNGKPSLIHFGDRSMQQYKDKLGAYSRLDHNDPKRRKSYKARARGIKDKMGNYTYKNKNSANYYSYHYLW